MPRELCSSRSLAFFYYVVQLQHALLFEKQASLSLKLQGNWDYTKLIMVCVA